MSIAFARRHLLALAIVPAIAAFGAAPDAASAKKVQPTTEKTETSAETTNTQGNKRVVGTTGRKVG